jgi:hypothetical protein
MAAVLIALQTKEKELLTSGCRSVGMVRLRTTATEFSFFFCTYLYFNLQGWGFTIIFFLNRSSNVAVQGLVFFGPLLIHT